MRVLQLIPSLQVGGAERVVALLTGGLRDLGQELTVVSLAAPSDSFIERELRGMPGLGLHFLGKGPGLDPRVVPRLARILRRERPEIVHTHLHTLKYLLPARLGAPGGRRGAGFRVVHTLHNLAEHEALRADRVLQQLAFRTGVIPVAIGEAVAQSVRQVYGLDAAVIPNGIPVAAQRSPPGTREALRVQLDLPADAPVFLSAGRLNPQKNHALLLRAFASPGLRALGARLLLAGEGELRGELEALVGSLGLQDRVRLLGVRSDVPALLAAADAFVLPSTWEGNPLVVMEAMAAGRAVLASAVGCVPELVGPQSGRLFPAGDSAALTGALEELARDLPLARRLGEGGAAEALARFDTPIMAAAYLDLYRQPRGRRGRPVGALRRA